jgi:hypothetical protein
MELHALRHKSTNILALGFEGDKRGKLHVQFHDGEGKATSRGYYTDVPRSLYNALEDDRKPGAFLNSHLKNKFEWVSESGTAEISAEEETEVLQPKATATPVKKKKAITPLERATAFAMRRCEDVGDFLKAENLTDGYTLIKFQRAAFYTPTDYSIGRAVYRRGSNYERPPLKRGKHLCL